MKSRLKKLARRYIPNFLHPYIYRLYAHINYIKNVINVSLKMRKVTADFINSPIIKNLSNLTTIQIIQPSFYDLDGFHFFSGGAERYLNDLSQIIVAMGYTPFIVQQGKTFWHKKHNNIDVFGVPSGNSFRLLNLFAHKPYFGKPRIRIYSPFTLAFPKVDKNAIGISHGIFWDRPHSTKLLPIILKSFLNVGIFVSVDTSTLSWFRATIPNKLTYKNMKYIPNYVDLKTFYPIARENNQKITIIYPRRLCHERGYFNVIKIAADILSKYPNVELHFVGHADSLTVSASKKLVKKFPSRVLLYKMLDKDMYTVYQQADIILIPTVASEGTSLSCLEAMATGNAIIATNIGGLSDLVIDGYNGLLIGPTAQELQNAIERLIINPDLRSSLKNNALEVAKSFNKSIWESRWTEILAQTVDK